MGYKEHFVGHTGLNLPTQVKSGLGLEQFLLPQFCPSFMRVIQMMQQRFTATWRPSPTFQLQKQLLRIIMHAWESHVPMLVDYLMTMVVILRMQSLVMILLVLQMEVYRPRL